MTILQFNDSTRALCTLYFGSLQVEFRTTISAGKDEGKPYVCLCQRDGGYFSVYAPTIKSGVWSLERVRFDGGTVQ